MLLKFRFDLRKLFYTALSKIQKIITHLETSFYLRVNQVFIDDFLISRSPSFSFLSSLNTENYHTLISR